MPLPDTLPTTIDADYADTPPPAGSPRADIKAAQQNLDALNALYNLLNPAQGSKPDGALPFYNSTTGKVEWIDPDVEGSPGPPGNDGIGFAPVVAWDSGTTYHEAADNDPPEFELVEFGGSTYLCLNTNTNSAPPGANWQLFASRGTDGNDGADGNPGASVTGPPGPPGPTEEGYDEVLNAAGAMDLDFGLASMVELVAVDDLDITLIDSSGTPATGGLLVVEQGAGGPHSIGFENVSLWLTSDGDPPDEATGLGEINVYTFARLPRNGWLGAAPGDGATGTPTPPEFPTLGLELLSGGGSTADQASPGGWTNIGTPVQVGDKRGGEYWVALTRNDGSDPVPPILEGGGAASWTLVDSVTQAGAALLRRGLYHYVARDLVSGAAAPFAVTLQGTTPAGTSPYTGMILAGIRTTGEVPASWVDTMLAKSVTRTSADSGENTGTIHCPFAAADDSTNRFAVGFTTNSTVNVAAGGTPVVFTPESGWQIAGSGTTFEIATPRQLLGIFLNPSSAADTTPSLTQSPTGQWLAAGGEHEQG